MTATSTVSALITDVTAIVSGATDWIGTFVGCITDNPLILMFVLFGFIGTGVGLIKRLMGL